MAGQQYKAKYDFVASGDGMLSFKTADQFSLVRKTNNDWWMVRSMSGDIGLAPVAYLEVSLVLCIVYRIYSIPYSGNILRV